MVKAFIDTSVILRILVRDDEKKIEACENLIKNAKSEGILLYVPSVAILETVWVLEKVYRLERRMIRELVEAILNTPELHCEMESVFRQAIRTYAEKNIKFADSVMGHWGLEKGFSLIYTYDEKDFLRIDGLKVKVP